MDIDTLRESDTGSVDGADYEVYFVSGGQNGTIIVWEFKPNGEDTEHKYRPIRRLEIDLAYDLDRTSKEHNMGIKDPRYHVQSVQFRANFVIAGTRSGDIYFCHVPSNLRPEENERIIPASRPTLVYSCHDNEIPKEVDFSDNHSSIFCITEKGLLTAWEFATLKKINSKHFGRSTVAMIVLKKNENNKKVIIAFDTQIIVMDTTTFLRMEDFSMDFHRKITDVKVSKNEEKMAVAFSSDQDGNNAYIELFKIDHTINRFSTTSKIENIASKIEFMDFSEDNYYLMYSDSVTQKCFYDLTNLKKNDTLAIDFDMEWVSDGIKLSEKTAELDKYCEEDNNFRCMVKAGNGSLIVTDEIGTV